MWMGLSRRPDNGRNMATLEEMMQFKTFNIAANGNPILC